MTEALALSAGQTLLKTVLGSSKSSTSDSSSTSSTTSISSSEGDFLNMLLTQITNQDPLEPMNNTEMVTQLAQFEMVEKMNNLDDKIGSMFVYQNMMNSVNFMGKEVSVLNSETGETVTGTVEGIQMQLGIPYVVIDGQCYDAALITEVNS